jgi:isocitrate dehydrogenase
LVKSFKLVPRLLDEGLRPKNGKLRINLDGTYFRRKINWFGPKNNVKRKALELKNQ